jgi:hypothetical protein
VEPIPVVLDEHQPSHDDSEELTRLVKGIEQEQRVQENLQREASKSAFLELLTQPFQPPPMFYERKAVLPQRHATIPKATSSQQ